MTKTKTRSWDAAEQLETEEEMAAYLEAAFEGNDPALVAAALGDIARAKGMTQIARETGLGRESLYKALSAEGNPEFATVLKVIRALGFRLHASTLEGWSLTDEELHKQLGKQANRIIGQRNAIRSGMKELERLAGTFAEGSSERQELTDALAVYGAEGTENGVTVATGASGNDAGTARPDFELLFLLLSQE
jgi:probable addiction module antidote protein